MAPLDDLPTNPGVEPPPHTDRTTPPQIEDGVSWLIAHQNADGSWQDVSQTAERDTAEAILALRDFEEANGNVLTGLQWLGGASPQHTDYLARVAEAIIRIGQDAGSSLEELLARQNPDGGFGSQANYVSNPMDTAFALRALAPAAYADVSVIEPAIEYLRVTQDDDGGWEGETRGGCIGTTVNAIIAFTYYRDAHGLEEPIQAALSWLMGRQNPDGGFGSSPSTIYDTVAVLSVLSSVEQSASIAAQALEYILSSQAENGSWHDSPHQTALAVQALWLWQGMVRPDLAVLPADITLVPARVVELPTTVAVSATIWNNGLTSVPEARVRLYDGPVSADNMVGELTIAFPARSSTTAPFTAPINDGNPHRLYVAVDPENEVVEAVESNNVASRKLENDTCTNPELSVGTAAISFSPPEVTELPQEIAISVVVTNSGYGEAAQTRVALYEGAESEDHKLDERTLDLAPRSTETAIFSVTIVDANPHQYRIVVDPGEQIAECDEENNEAIKFLYSGATHDLAIQPTDISVSPESALLYEDLTIKATVTNRGTADAFDVPIKITVDSPSGTHDVATVPRDIPAGGTSELEVVWTAEIYGDNLSLTVHVDPQDQFAELSEANNVASIPLIVNPRTEPDLAISHGDIEITPTPARQSGSATISANVGNQGFSLAADVSVSFYQGTSEADQVLLGRRSIETLAPGESSTVE
jgi:hypothetical protein